MTDTTPTTRTLPLLEDQSTDSDSEGCGCGGCGCGSDAGSGTAPATSDWTDEEHLMTTTKRYGVAGMTCGHCIGAVTSELKSLDGVTDVQVDLVAGGTSTVTVISSEPLAEAQVIEALVEAGDYHLTAVNP